MDRIRKESDARWNYIYRITRQFMDEWERAFFVGVNELKSDASLKLLTQAIEYGQPSVVVNGLPWQDAEEKLGNSWKPKLEQVLQRGAMAELRRLNMPLKFDLQNPYALRYIEQHTAKLVTQVTLETQQAIRSVVLQGFENGSAPRRMAMRIREMIGLTDRDAKAVMRRWETLAQDGTRSARQVDEMTDAYARKLLRRRAENIARTETVDAAASGTHLSQLEARDRGLVPLESRRVWIAASESDRTCPICLNMDNQEVGMDEPFYSEILGTSVMTPPIHPSCRCATGLRTPRP